MSSKGKTGKTGLIFFPAFDWAISPTHPEREERLLYTRDQIFEEGLMVPPIKLWDAGVPNRAALAIMTRNSRMPESLDEPLRLVSVTAETFLDA